MAAAGFLRMRSLWDLAGSSFAGRVILFVLAGIGLVVSGLLIVPFSPWMPVPGLDASWQYALNEAIARHLVFGKDIVFTFGPLAPVDTQLYHPATDWIMMWGSAAIAIGFCAAALVLASFRHQWMLILLPFCVASAYFRDSIFLALPFLLLLSVSAVYGPGDRKPRPRHEVAILLAFASTALLPLVKGSFAGMAGAEIGVSLLLLVLYGRLSVALRAAAISVFFPILAWWATGQPLTALPGFFLAQSDIISGYTEAMSFHGQFVTVLYFWVAAVLMLVAEHLGRVRHDGIRGMIPTLGLLFGLFIVFKAGFVRQDVHPRIAADVFLLLGLGVAASVRRRVGAWVLLLSLVAFFAIENTTKHFGRVAAYTRIANAVTATVQGIDLRLSDPAALRSRFAAAKVQIAKVAALPAVQGRSDVYPVELSILFANDIDWDPRPVIQSYSAYTPGLDRRNADHLLGSDAPRNVFLSVGPIDERIATLEDAHSWPLLLSRYGIHENLGSRLWLTLDPVTSGALVLGRQASVAAAFDTPVSVPFAGPVWASIDISPNLLGRLGLLLFKLPTIKAALSLSDGSVVLRRFIPEMAGGGFMLSPSIGSVGDFIDVAAGHYDRRRVVSIRLLAPITLFWSGRINVVFHELQLPIQKLDSLTGR